MGDVCGFDSMGTCAIVDKYYIEHLDQTTASGALYRGQPYWKYGFRDWDSYEEFMNGKVEEVQEKEKSIKETLWGNDRLTSSKYQRDVRQFKTLKKITIEQT